MVTRWPTADQTEYVSRRQAKAAALADADLHPGQREIMRSVARFNAVACGRRFGKTELGKRLSKRIMRAGQPVGWFAPTYKIMIEVWADLRRELADEIHAANKMEMRIELHNGGRIDFWTLINPDAGRGRKYKRVIVDEAAMVRNLGYIWSAAIRPTLTDLKGDAFFFSTPKGMDAFWQMYQMGQDDAAKEWQSWQMPTATNPHIDPAEIEAARQMLPERIFSQEYLAAFLDDAGGVFRRVMDATGARERDRAQDGRDYVIGVDWGKYEDFTVYTVLDVTSREVVHIDRFNQIDYQVQLSRLQALAGRFSPASIAVERNSIGDPLIEQLKRAGLPVAPFTVTSGSKTNLIDNLALAFERGEIRIPNDPVLVGELQAYEMERLPSGTLRYNAPAGLHDDCVMSLAFAWWEMSESARRTISTDSVDFYGRTAQPVGMAGFYG